LCTINNFQTSKQKHDAIIKYYRIVVGTLEDGELAYVSNLWGFFSCKFQNYRVWKSFTTGYYFTLVTCMPNFKSKQIVESFFTHLSWTSFTLVHYMVESFWKTKTKTKHSFLNKFENDCFKYFFVNHTLKPLVVKYNHEICKYKTNSNWIVSKPK